MLDSKENSYEGVATNTLEKFKIYIESYLELKTSIALQNNSAEIITKEMLCDKLFSRVVKILGTKH